MRTPESLTALLPHKRLAALLEGFGRTRVAVIGDFFLDRYLVTDPALTEPSLETGLQARAVVARRSSPGHAGTVTNNLGALGVGTIYALGYTGDDGEGYELRRALKASGVDITYLSVSPDVVTGTYVKPTVLSPTGIERELERLDIKNRHPLPAALEADMIRALERIVAPDAAQVDAVVVADQVEERNHGAITDAVRDALCRLARERTDLVWFVDSRRRIGEYRHVQLKPNRTEALTAAGEAAPAGDADDVAQALGVARLLAGRTERNVFLTLSEAGMLVVRPKGDATHVPAVPLQGPIDPTGAGDSATAGIVPSLALGATPEEAACVGALISGITVRQLGTTGTARPEMVLAAHATLCQG